MSEAKISFYPMLADPFGEMASGNRDRWEKYRTLSAVEKDIIVSGELALNLEKLSASRNLGDKEGEFLADIARRFLLKEISGKDIPGLVQKNIPNSDSRAVADELIKTIGGVVSAGSDQPKEESEGVAEPEESLEEVSESKVSGPLVRIKMEEALKKYDRLWDQTLSANPIKTKSGAASMRPSIKNWIADYYEKMEARKHDSIERGNYLFHSENGRGLTTGDRQRVGTILRDLDENAMVTVDEGRQEVIFGDPNMGQEDSGAAPSPVRESGRGSFGLPMGRQNAAPVSNFFNRKND